MERALLGCVELFSSPPGEEQCESREDEGEGDNEEEESDDNDCDTFVEEGDDEGIGIV